MKGVKHELGVLNSQPDDDNNKNIHEYEPNLCIDTSSNPGEHKTRAPGRRGD
jgi:hypothetical protein